VDEVDAGRDVAPLVAAPDLQDALLLAMEGVKVVRLEELVRKFRIADARLGRETGLDAVLAEHGRDADVPAHAADKVEDVCAFVKVGVVHKGDRWHVRAHRQPASKDAFELLLDLYGIVHDNLLVLLRPFSGAPARVADQTGGTADEGDRPVPLFLEAKECDHGEQVAHVQARCRRVKAAVERQWLGGQSCLEECCTRVFVSLLCVCWGRGEGGEGGRCEECILGDIGNESPQTECLQHSLEKTIVNANCSINCAKRKKKKILQLEQRNQTGQTRQGNKGRKK